MSQILESEKGNMLDFPKIRAFIWLQTKNKFGWHIKKFQNFEAFQMVDARGHLLQLRARSNLKLFKKRATPSTVGILQLEAFGEEVGRLYLLSTYSILPNNEAVET